MQRPSTTRSRLHRRGRPAATAALVAAALTVLLPGTGAQAATLSVNCDTGGNLEARIQASSTGSTILVKGTCIGNFTIAGKALTIKGNPTATLDGDDAFRPLGINSPGKVVHLVGLTVTGGVAQFGAGIFSIADGLTLDRVTVKDNLATSSSAPATGGGIFAAGNLTLTDSTVSGNRARTTDGGGEANGGGIATTGGDLTITHSKVTGNRATADLSSGDSDAAGGGIFLSSGELTMKGTTVAANRVVASGPGPVSAIGGGVYTQFAPPTDSVNDSVITGNAATASSAGQATAAGGGIHDTRLHVTASTVSNNLAVASGSSVLVQGGGLGAEGVTLTRSTVSGNRARGASTSSDANTQGGGIAAEGVAITASTISRNTAVATTTGPTEANAEGGGVRSLQATVTNSTVAFNKATATSTGSAPASAAGGGLFATANSTVIASTIAGNALSASGSTASADGGGLWAAELDFEATIVANNTATTGPDCFGGPTSDGHNLVRKPVGCSFAKKSTDIVGQDPKLGALAKNGGPTRTMAIALGSPARNAIPQAACAVATDQRGTHRPQGPQCDMGAYERKVP